MLPFYGDLQLQKVSNEQFGRFCSRRKVQTGSLEDSAAAERFKQAVWRILQLQKGSNLQFGRFCSCRKGQVASASGNGAFVGMFSFGST
jgi:hypothetical protein